MSRLFIALLNVSLAASFVALAVMLVRLLLKRAPRVFSYALWAVVFFRLACPLAIEIPVRINPIAPQTVPQDIVYAQNPAIHSGVAFLNSAVNELMESALPPVAPENSINPLQLILEAGAYIWLAGITALLIYAAFSYMRIRRGVGWAVRVKENIYETDRIKTPFILGCVRPRIYIPSGLSAGELGYILNHEQIHIKRLDHLVKPLAFLIAVAHWFNPLAWLSFYLLVQDMELSADESVIGAAGSDIRRDYSRSLYALSARNSGLLSPLAFGETGVKSRVKNVLRFRKPVLWESLLSAVLVCLTVVALSTSACAPAPGLINPDDPDSLCGNYIFDRLIYMNPLSSYMPQKGMQEYYNLSRSMLTIVNLEGERQYVAISLDEKRPLDQQGFDDLFMPDLEKPDLSRFKVCCEYRLCENDNNHSYCLFLLDKDIWLARLHSKAGMWSIYRIKKYSGALPSPAYNADPAFYEWSSTISMPIPAPPGATDFFQSGGDGSVDCRGCSKRDLDQYVQSLEEEGWALLPQEPESMVYMLIRGNDMVYLVDHTYEEEGYNSLQVSYAPGYRGPAESGRRHAEEAASIIQGYLDSLESADAHGYGKKVHAVREIDLGDAYEKMGLQGFEVYGTGYQEAFAIGKTGALLGLGFAEEVRTADINGDGEMELITLGAWGSGIYRIVVTAFKYKAADDVYELAYSNCWIPVNITEGVCWNMSLVKIDDRTVHLYGADLVAGRFVPKVDYGKLQVSGDRLVPTARDIPFKEWGSW